MPEKIRVFGATGGRFDHMFANIQLLIQANKNKKDVEIELIDHQNIIFLKAPGTYRLQKITDKKYISFIPISAEVKGLTLKDLNIH